VAEKVESTDAMRSLIGVESQPWTHEVTTTSVRAFARGVGYTGGVEEKGERLAELELHMMNEHGRNTTPGTAVVRFL